METQRILTCCTRQVLQKRPGSAMSQACCMMERACNADECWSNTHRRRRCWRCLMLRGWRRRCHLLSGWRRCCRMLRGCRRRCPMLRGWCNCSCMLLCSLLADSRSSCAAGTAAGSSPRLWLRIHHCRCRLQSCRQYQADADFCTSPAVHRAASAALLTQFDITSAPAPAHSVMMSIRPV